MLRSYSRSVSDSSNTPFPSPNSEVVSEFPAQKPNSLGTTGLGRSLTGWVAAAALLRYAGLGRNPKVLLDAYNGALLERPLITKAVGTGTTVTTPPHPHLHRIRRPPPAARTRTSQQTHTRTHIRTHIHTHIRTYSNPHPAILADGSMYSAISRRRRSSGGGFARTNGPIYGGLSGSHQWGGFGWGPS